jgi:hypothetical protein
MVWFGLCSRPILSGPGKSANANFAMRGHARTRLPGPATSGAA